MKLNKFTILCLVIYAAVTIYFNYTHVMWFDEAHSWLIAKQLGFVDMLKYIKNEGHFFVWQVLLYPFAHIKFNLYPYVMKVLNWSFCMCAVVILWWKAPFNNCIKALITFSFPFLVCYSVLARCYSIGILLLFALAALYENKFKYPKTYALLLILCANTSVMALIGATAFGILFVVDVVKNKLPIKQIIITLLILLIGAAAVLLQVIKINYFSTIVENGHFYTSLIMFENTYISNNLLVNSILSLIFSIPVLMYLFRDRASLFFFSFTYVLMLILAFNFYGMNFWHAYFFFVYLIISLWINRAGKLLSGKFAHTALALISFLLIFNLPVKENYNETLKSDCKIIKSFIENDENLKNALILHNSGIMYEILPYRKKAAYKIKNYCTEKDNKDYDLKNLIGNDCVRGNIFGQAQKYPDLIKSFVSDKTYAYTEKDKNIQVVNYGIIMAEDYQLLIKKYKCIENHCFWKIEAINENAKSD